MKEVAKFIKEAVELTSQIAELTGKVGVENYPQKSIPQKPKGYVIKTGSSPVKKLLSNTKKAELTLTLNVEPILGEPIHLSFSARLKRGGSDDPGGKNRKTGG